MIKHRKTFQLVLWFALLTAIFLIGLWVGYKINLNKYFTGNNAGTQLRITDDAKYSFISPLLACISPSKELFSEYKGLDNKLKSLVNQRIKSGNAQRISVYFRDLQSGHWTGVNENEKFAPASLFKVMLMIALYKQADEQPNLLSRQIYYDQPSDTETNFVSLLKPKSSYTVNQLIKAMIVDSDNNAKDLLMSLVKADVLNQVIDELNIPLPDNAQLAKTDNLISPRDYSILLRVLYNATFLSNDMSEKALQLLSQTTFKDGLVSKLPNSVTVAHKFGSFVVSDQSGNNQLHDCGIVYDANRPYVICVMTQGNNSNQLTSVIQDVSDMVYRYVSSLSK